VQHEFSYDKFHQSVERIYRVNQTFIWGENNNSQFASTGPGVAYAIQEELPEVELMTSIHTPGNFIISYTNPAQEVISFEEQRVFAADSNFFKMFNFPLLKGNVETVFGQANNLVMTRSTAQKYFGDEDPIGKLVYLGGANGEEKRTYEVTGVMEDTPGNSYMKFDVLLSMKGFPIERFYWSWVWTQLETYVRLNPNANIETVRGKLAEIPRKHAGETLKAVFNLTYDEYIKSGKKWELFLQPMTSIHLPDEPVINRLSDSGNITVIYSFIAAAVFIVLLSCVNFMNLSTAQFTRRLKEASVRKILGQGKQSLGIGYFFEALAFCVIALVLALGLTQLLLPGFNLLTEKTLQLNLLQNGELQLGLVGLILLMALFSASYPALFLTTFHPIEAIKGKVKIGREGKSFRHLLVVFQFSASIVLVICTAVVFQQLKYVSQKDVGFAKENLVVLNHLETLKDGEGLAHAILNVPGVTGATWCSAVPPRIWDGDSFGYEGSDLRFALNFLRADENYIPALSIRLTVGRNFSTDNPCDSSRVIVNEAMLRKIGWAVDESVIGKKIAYDNSTFEIIGVVSDFNYWSLDNPIEPLGIFHIKNKNIYPPKRQFLALRVDAQKTESWEATVEQLRQVWKAQAGDLPFDYYFVDNAFAESFKSQYQFGNILTVMASFAMMIAALGLLGMLVYSLEQRTKEIGIRKISGASVWNILVLVSKNYALLIAIAFIVGAPVSYWLMQQWLLAFAFRVQPSMLIYLLAGLGAFVVAMLITIYHSWRAAQANPVEVLKDE
jgi:putative ABC transport system permease protein